MALVELLMTPGCAGCPQAEKIVSEVVAEFDGARWEEIDITDEPEKATQHGLMSVPAVIVDGEPFGSGVPARDALRQRVREAVGA